MKLWQIASGDSSRDYSDLCLRHDVMLLGPGNPGVYHKHKYSDVRGRGAIRAFVQDVKPGDVVLLRNGHQVVGVGRIPDGRDNGYRHSPSFDDVLGWDLQHTRRVIWDPMGLEVLKDQQPVFANYKQQKRFTRVREKRLTKLLSKFDRVLPDRPVKQLLEAGPILKDDEVGSDLFSSGLANDSVEKVLTAIRRTRRLQKWFRTEHSGKRPSETEAVAHMIVPLLLGLGWSEQLLGIEWKRIDLAVFSTTVS